MAWPVCRQHWPRAVGHTASPVFRVQIRCPPVSSWKVRAYHDFRSPTSVLFSGPFGDSLFGNTAGERQQRCLLTDEGLTSAVTWFPCHCAWVYRGFMAQVAFANYRLYHTTPPAVAIKLTCGCWGTTAMALSEETGKKDFMWEATIGFLFHLPPFVIGIM